MILVEKHNIGINHVHFNELDKLSFLSKNLFNMSLYNIRQHYFNTNTFLSLKENYKLLNKVQKNDYKALPSKISNQVIKQVDTAFKSFFMANKKYKENPSKFTGKPKITNYKDKVDGRNILTYEKKAVSKKAIKNGLINLTYSTLSISTNVKYDELKCVRIIKRLNSYVIEIAYEKKEMELKTNNFKYSGGDLGLNNLITVTFNNGERPLIINGKPLKSINHFYNKELSRLKSELEVKNNKKISKRIKRLTEKRNNKINDYLHKTSKMLVNQLVSKDISKIAVGKNNGWKQDINIGKKNNQNFVQVPFNNFINMLDYKLKLKGIELILINEAYTSKCSFLDSEEIKKHTTYSGKRIKRGLFKTNKGLIINADVNGSFNILKKAFPNAFADGIQDLAVNPLKLILS